MTDIMSVKDLKACFKKPSYRAARIASDYVMDYVVEQMEGGDEGEANGRRVLGEFHSGSSTERVMAEG